MMFYYGLVCVEQGGTRGQPDRQKLLLTRVRPQSVSGSASLTACHWPAYGLGLALLLLLAFPPLRRNKLSTAADYKQLKQREPGRLLTGLFHKKGKGVRAEQVVSGGGRRGAKRRHMEQKRPSVRFPQGRPFTAEWRWHDLPGSKEALQQTFQQRFGVWPHNRTLF